MSKSLTKEQRQEVLEEYMRDTGRDIIKNVDFLDWLEPQHNHYAWPWFFSATPEAMREHYLNSRFQQFMSGLRIPVREQKVVQRKGEPIQIRPREVKERPLYISPLSTRADGGGYVRFEPDNKVLVEDLRRQGALMINQWLTRFESVFEDMPLDQLRAIAALADPRDKAA